MYFSALSTPFNPYIFPTLKLDFSSYYVENFEVRVRVRSATGQKARVRAKCVRAKVVRCGVRACGQKSVTPNTLIITFLQKIFERFSEMQQVYSDILIS